VRISVLFVNFPVIYPVLFAKLPESACTDLFPPALSGLPAGENLTSNSGILLGSSPILRCPAVQNTQFHYSVFALCKRSF
jgi:hypothetical protein